MRRIINKFTESKYGRHVYAPFQALLRLSRRIARPNLPPDRDLVRVSYRDRKFTMEIRRWSDDRGIIAQCFTDGQYDMPVGVHGVFVERTYRDIVASGKTPLIVDCGANIGASVLWFTARYPEAQIVAIEPAPDNFELLRRNTAAVAADLRAAGIGPADGSAWLENPGDGGPSYRTSGRSGEGVQVQILSIATILASKPASQYVPFLLKVDIEGAEKSLFTGAAEVMDQFPLIIVEPHDWMLPGQQTSVEFFRFHAQAGREFSFKHENVASIRCDPRLLQIAREEPSLIKQ